MKVVEAAQITYELNRAYCQALGDNSFPEWNDAPQWQKETNINGVKFHLSNPEAGTDASHNAWMAAKAEEGWRYGPVKNPETKEHPCFVPYDQLPTEQKAKDFIFRQAVHSLAPFITEQIPFA